MAGFCKIVVMGNLTRDVELSSTRGGTQTAKFGVAINERRKGANGEWTDSPTFFNVVLWGKTAEFAHEKLKKGDRVIVEGKHVQERWMKDGEEKVMWTLNATGFEQVDRKPERSESTAGASRPLLHSGADEEEVPF